MSLAEVISLQPEASPAERWRDRLLAELSVRAAIVAGYERYYDGDHPLPSPPAKMQQVPEAARAFGDLSKLGVTNFCPPIVDSPVSRLRVTGFRFGEVDNAAGDPDVWRIWQRNHLDADSALVHHAALLTGQAYTLTWPGEMGADITVEHPSQTVVAYKAGSRRHRSAGLKCWTEDDGTWRAVLYLPTEVYKWIGKPRAGNLPMAWTEWQPATDDTWPIANPLGQVPLVEFRANPSLRPALYGGGRSELAGGAITIQNRINKTVFDRLVTAEFQAFRQRWSIGWEPDDLNDVIRMSQAHLMSMPEGVTLGEFSQADFTPFLSAVKADLEALAALTSTPFYQLGSLVNPPSGDALMALQSGLISKTEAHRDNFGESWEEVLRLALTAQQDSRAADEQSTVLWRSVARVTFAEKADAAVKYKAVDVPDEAIWTDVLDFSEQDVERFKAQRADQALFAPQVPVAPGQ